MSDIIGITMGDPAGVGPEIAIKAIVEMGATSAPGSGSTATWRRLRRPGCGWGHGRPGRLVVDLPIEGGPLPWGTLDPRGGDAAFRFIDKAVRDAEAGIIGCIVTRAINKEALNLAGHTTMAIPGCWPSDGQKTAWMLLASDRLKVIQSLPTCPSRPLSIEPRPSASSPPSASATSI